MASLQCELNCVGSLLRQEVVPELQKDRELGITTPISYLIPFEIEHVALKKMIFIIKLITKKVNKLNLNYVSLSLFPNFFKKILRFLIINRHTFVYKALGKLFVNKHSSDKQSINNLEIKLRELKALQLGPSTCQD